jgi:hypothetical protein
MKESLFEQIIKKLDKPAICGILLCFITISVGNFFNSYFLDKIPDDAKYEDISIRSRDYHGNPDAYEYQEYDNEIYDNYNSISDVFFYLPILIAFILLLIKVFLKWRHKEKLSEIESKDGKEALEAHLRSYEYTYFKETEFYSFFSAYFLGLIVVITYILLDTIIEVILVSLF